VAANGHDTTVWNTGNPLARYGLERTAQKVNVWCAVMHDRVFGPSFSAKNTVGSGPYLLELHAVPQIQDVGLFFALFQQD
jgi:hypothetical protein